MAELDLTRLAYIAKHRCEEMSFSYSQLQTLTGASRRQISYVMNGKPVNAAATFLICEVLDIDLAEMLPPDLAKMLVSVRELKKSIDNQPVTPRVARETDFPNLVNGGA